MLRRVLGRFGAQRGFSIIELVVVLAGSMVVLAALFGIIDATLHQSTNTFSRVDATARARNTVESIINELQSSCTSSGATPVQAGSTANSLTFTTQFGNAVSPTPVQHQIGFDPSAGTLTDTTTSGARTLLTGVSQVPGIPVFQYFAYQEPVNGTGQPYTDSAGNPYMMLLDGSAPIPGTSTIPTARPLSTPLSGSDAQFTVEVLITLSVGAGGGSLENTTTTTPVITDKVADSVVMRFSPAANHAGAGATFGPCQ